MATLKVKSTLDPSGFNKGVEGMKRKAREINGSGGGIFGGGAGGGGMGFGKTTMAVGAGNILKDMLSAIKDLAMAGGKELVQLGTNAKNLGTDIKGINEIQDALAEFGVSGETVIAMLERVDMARQEAIEGNDKLAKSFSDAGISMDELTRKEAPELFQKLTESLSKGGEGGYTAVESIIGKRQMRGMQVPLERYGAGFRKEHYNEPTQQDADILAIVERKKRSAATAAKNTEARAEAAIVGMTVSKEELEAYRKEQEEIKAKRAAARELARKAAEGRKQAVIDEKQGEVRKEFADRMAEAEQGIKPDRMEVDQFHQVGLGAGPMADFGQYAEGRRIMEVAEKQTKLIEEMNKKLAEIKDAINKGSTDSEGSDF